MKLLPAAWVMALNLSKSRSRQNIADGQYPEAPIRFRNLPLLDEYARIVADVTRTAALYFSRQVPRKYKSFKADGRDARAVRRSRQTASCLRAFAPRSSRRNTTNRPCRRRR